MEEIPAPSQDVRTLASLRAESQIPSNPPLFPCSSVDRMSEAHQEGFQSMYNYSRQHSVPVFSEKSPNVLLRNGSLLKNPCLLNSMPPLGPRSYALGLTTVLPLQLCGADGEKGCFPNNDKSQIKQLGKRCRETIVISDGEEDELDLTLKL